MFMCKPVGVQVLVKALLSPWVALCCQMCACASLGYLPSPTAGWTWEWQQQHTQQQEKALGSYSPPDLAYLNSQLHGLTSAF